MNIGIIEGFYGKTWSWQDRHAMLNFLSKYEFQSYIYAPKADEQLRKHWQSHWGGNKFNELLCLSDKAHQLGVRFGLGLSPISLMDDWNASTQKNLQQRLQQIKALKPHILAILFDDIQGDKSHLASLQIEISHFIRAELPKTELWVCPTYYSFDPILPELFGDMPNHYWQELGQGLHPDIQLLWTGDKVISEQYTAKSIEKINQLFQRQVIIWDNSRVNDGRKTSPYLPIQAMPSFASISGVSNGMLINPMNQAHWAMVNILTSKFQGTEEERLRQAIQALCPELEKTFFLHLNSLKNIGLDTLSEQERGWIAQDFCQHTNPFSQEVLQWLEGEYRFDPLCLT